MMGEKLPHFLQKRAYLTPNRIAVVFHEKKYTFKELYNLSAEMAGKLKRLGVRREQFVGVLLANHIDTVVIFLSLQLLGARAVILNNRLTPEELLWQLHDSRSSFLISENLFSDNLSVVEQNFEGTILIKENTGKVLPDELELLSEVDLDEICTIMYTSGTTGKPKGVIQTYGNHWWSAVGSALNLGLQEEDCWLCTVPLFHISGYSILMRSLIYGMKIVLHSSFNEEDVLRDIQRENVTIMSVVATTLKRIVHALGNERLPSSFRCMLLGGGPAPLALLENCVEKGIPVYQTYGMTETSSQIVTLSPEYSIEKLGSAGKPLFPCQLQICDESGSPLGPNESGEICVKGPNVTRGYLNREEERKDGWFHTGDIGYLDEEGFLYVQDRRSDLIISGGENIYPAEIEGVLTAHPCISDAGVVGKDDEKWGQIPVAFVVKKEEITEEEILDYCAKKLGKFKLPKEIHFVDELPRNASNKLMRRKLRDMLG